MKPTLLEIPYNGQSFLIDIAEGNMVSLNKLYDIAGAPSNQDPSQWVRLEITKKLIESTNMGKTHIYKTKRGIGSHHHFKHDVKLGLVTVPHPKKDTPIGTVKSILKQAGLK